MSDNKPTDDPDLKAQIAALLRSHPRSPLEISALLRAPIADVGRALLELIREGRIYTFHRSKEDRLYFSKRPREACLTDEEKRLRYEARAYSYYGNERR